MSVSSRLFFTSSYYSYVGHSPGGVELQAIKGVGLVMTRAQPPLHTN